MELSNELGVERFATLVLLKRHWIAKMMVVWSDSVISRQKFDLLTKETIL